MDNKSDLELECDASINSLIKYWEHGGTYLIIYITGAMAFCGKDSQSDLFFLYQIIQIKKG